MVLAISKAKKKSLKKLFQNYKGKNLAKCFIWDSPKGKEIIKN